jgi:ketosteroid isomerase-like protein
LQGLADAELANEIDLMHNVASFRLGKAAVFESWIHASPGRNLVSLEETTRIAKELLARMGAGADHDEIAALFSTDLDFEIAGDVGVLPWIARSVGRSAAADFFRDVRRLVEPLRFEIHDILTNDSLAVIVGELASRVTSTGKTVETGFAFVLTVSGGEITRFRMLEDSFAVSRAARA